MAVSCRSDLIISYQVSLKMFTSQSRQKMVRQVSFRSDSTHILKLGST